MSVLWERQSEESEKQYALFCLWRDLPPTERTNKRVIEVTKRDRTTITQYKRRFRWIERARAYDNYLQRREIEQDLAAREAASADYGAATVASLREKLSIIDTLLTRELRAQIDAQSTGEPIDVLRVKRILGAIAEQDTLARRSANLPTAIRGAAATEQVDSSTIYTIGGIDDEE